MLKLRFSTPNRSARGSPLAHAVGEGLGVRAPRMLSPRKIPLNFPRIAPSPLDIRARDVLYYKRHRGNSRGTPLTNPTKVGYNRGHDGECNSPSAVKRTNILFLCSVVAAASVRFAPNSATNLRKEDV